MECPHCGKDAWPFWNANGLFSAKKENKRCKKCKNLLKIEFSNWFQCGGIFLGGLFIYPIFSKLLCKTKHIVQEQNNGLVQGIPTFDFNDLWGFLIACLWLYLSYEIPARYLGKRSFKTGKNQELD